MQLPNSPSTDELEEGYKSEQITPYKEWKG